jgi:hypothetical protein
MLYAINVPIDIMSTSSFRSNRRVIKAANEKNYNFTRLLHNTSKEIIVFILLWDTVVLLVMIVTVKHISYLLLSYSRTI